jgi:hypothetical protein
LCITARRCFKEKGARGTVAAESNTAAPKNWTAKITMSSDALDLEKGIFTWKDPIKIAQSLKHSADTSTRRKSPPFRSAMSMLVFYINRAGSTLDPDQKRILEQAKDELRILYGRDELVKYKK